MTGTAQVALFYSYMLRLWPEPQQSGETHWRFTLVDPGTGRRRAFASLAALLDYLTQFIQNDSFTPDLFTIEHALTPNGCGRGCFTGRSHPDRGVA